VWALLRLWSTEKRRLRALPPEVVNPYRFGGAMLPVDATRGRGVAPHPARLRAAPPTPGFYAPVAYALGSVIDS